MEQVGCPTSPPDHISSASSKVSKLREPPACPDESKSSTLLGENQDAVVEYRDGTTDSTGDIINPQKKAIENISGGTPKSDQFNTDSAEENPEIGEPPACPDERKRSTDPKENRDAPAEHCEGAPGNTGDVFDHQKEQAMEKKFRGASTSGQINTACAEENAELGATEPNRNDGSRCLCQDSSQKQPTTSCSSVSYEGLEEELSAPGKEAASEMNGPEYKHPPCLPDITNSSFEEIINILREMGGRSDDGMIKVDAEYLRDCLGEEKAKKLVKYFNKNEFLNGA